MTFHDFLRQYGLKPEVFDVLHTLPKIPIKKEIKPTPKVDINYSFIVTDNKSQYIH
jgi:hypothetical protein